MTASEWPRFMLNNLDETVCIGQAEAIRNFANRQKEPKTEVSFPICEQYGWNDYEVVNGMALVALGGGLLVAVAPVLGEPLRKKPHSKQELP